MIKNNSKLTVLSFGGGQDSTALLYLLAFVPEFREYYAPQDLLVVMSDTGNEFPQTYIHVLLSQQFCKEQNIEFVHVKPEMGYHAKHWQSLTSYFAHYNVVMSKFFFKSCTDQLKIQPIYKFLNNWVAKKYDLPQKSGKFKNKNALVEFAKKYGKINVLLGIAKGEESRVGSDSEMTSEWMRRSVTRLYPLIKLGWDRAKCQDFIRSLGKTVPPPSNCMFCPFMNLIELLYLARRYPHAVQEWANFEAAKLKKFANKGDANYGALDKTRTILEMVEVAEKKYGHWPIGKLEEYRFSHGHCVKSKY